MPDFTGQRIAHTRVAGVPVALASEQDLVTLMLDDCARRRSGELGRAIRVFDCNGQALSLYASNTEFADAMNAADLIHADGQFVVWVSRMSGQKVPERTATTDLIHAAAQAAAQRGLGFYLLGGIEDVNRECAQELQRRYPGLVIAGRHHGYFSRQEEEAIVAGVNASGADIVWIGLGKPEEQAFTARNAERLKAGWIVTCGGCFNYVTGAYRRAPQWMQSAGLEWLHRMATGPRYLIRRYAVTIPHAIGLVLRDRARRGRASTGT